MTYYYLISDDARCPCARGSRSKMYTLRARALRLAEEQMYLGHSSGGIDPHDVRVIREDRAQRILAERAERQRAQAEEDKRLRLAAQIKMCRNAILPQDVAQAQAEAITDPTFRWIIEAIRADAAYARDVGPWYRGGVANLALAAYHPDYPYRWGHEYQWSPVAYVREIVRTAEQERA